MSRITALPIEDDRLVTDLIDGMLKGRPSVRTTDVTKRIVASLQAKARRGDKQAARIVVGLAVDGVRSRVETRVKAERTHVKTTRSDTAVSISARVGHRKRKGSGRTEGYYQQTLWYELPWDELASVMRFRERQRDALSVSIEAYEEILKLRTIYPHTKTPQEACEMHGVDPRDFDLREGRSA